MNTLVPLLILVVVAIVVYLHKIREPEERPPAIPPPEDRLPPVTPPITPPTPPVTPPVEPPAPPVRPPANIRPLPNPEWERIRRTLAHDLKRRGWQEAYTRFLLETNPNQPGSASVAALYATYQAIFRETVGDRPPVRPPAPPVTPPVRPPAPPAPPVTPPVTPPDEIRPLPDSYLESVRRSYAHDLRRRGGEKWIAAEREFLLATNPGMPGSANLDAIVATYREIFNRTVAKPDPRPPVRPPVTPPAPPGIPPTPPDLPPDEPPVRPPRPPVRRPRPPVRQPRPPVRPPRPRPPGELPPPPAPIPI